MRQGQTTGTADPTQERVPDGHVAGGCYAAIAVQNRRQANSRWLTPSSHWACQSPGVRYVRLYTLGALSSRPRCACDCFAWAQNSPYCRVAEKTQNFANRVESQDCPTVALVKVRFGMWGIGLECPCYQRRVSRHSLACAFLTPER